MSSKLKECLELIAIAEDRSSKEFFAVIRFGDMKGGVRRRKLPLATLDDKNALRKELITMGAYFASDNNDSILELRAAKERVPRWDYAKRLGWSGWRFVRPKATLGKQRQNCVLKPPRVLSHAAKKMKTCGTLGGWRKHVADPAGRSSRMVTAICAAFAAPLLKFTDAPSFALFFTGQSKLGKSTSTLAAGSVIGFKTEKALPNFRSTDAALGELPAQFNDHMLPLNEFGLLRGTYKERRQRLRELAFGAAEGNTTTYSRLSPAGDTGQDEYRSILVANGEETSDELAMRAGEFRLAGECSRWMDVPAIERSSPDIFDFAPDLGSKKRAAWFKKTCADLRTACLLHHGIAIQDFLGNVIRRRKTVREELIKQCGLFIDAIAKGESNQVALHMARNFAQLYAAGVLAVQFKTVPWSEKQVMNCIRRCYQAARREIKTEAELLRRAQRRLTITASKQSILVMKRHKGTSLKKADGYRRKDGQNLVLTVRAEAFKRWFDDPRQPRLVLDWLRKQRALGNSAAPGQGQGIMWAESQPLWPDGARHRSIVITLSTSAWKRMKQAS